MSTDVALVTVTAEGKPLAGVVAYLQAPGLAQGFLFGITNPDGYALFKGVPEAFSGLLQLSGAAAYYEQPVDIKGVNVTIRVGPSHANPQDVVLPACQPFKKGSALPAPPTRDEIIGVGIHFQGLVVPTEQYGVLPWFEAALPWMTKADRSAAYAVKLAVGDTHCIIDMPCGTPLYDEPNQPYSPDRFGPLDWTAGGTAIQPQLTDLIREVAAAGFPSILLYLGGDGDGDHYKAAFEQLELLHQCEDYRETLWKYCVVLPGWDGVFYGWPLEQVMNFGVRFRELFPQGHLGLHYSTGHIPVGEGGGDYLPRPQGGDPQQNPGRMADYDLLLGEFDDNLHQDSCWQILNRLEANYVRPPDQPAGDDPNRAYYLGVDNPRGPWGHCAMEYGLYEYVRADPANNYAVAVAHVNANRAYMKSMGTRFTG